MRACRTELQARIFVTDEIGHVESIRDVDVMPDVVVG